MQFDGIFPVLITPFAANGSIDDASLDREVDLVADRGVQGVVLFGLVSEGYKLTEVEREQIATRVVQRLHGRLPVVAGAEHNGTRAAAELARRLQGCGVDAIMSLPPMLGKPTSDDLRRYYAAIAAAISAPIVIQDAPAASGVAMPAALLARILAEAQTPGYVKVEAPPTSSKMRELAALTKGTAGMFGGMAGRYYLQELHAGACGSMPGPAFPDALARVHRLYRGGQYQSAEAEFYRILPAIVFGEGNDQLTHLTKQLFWRDGVIDAASVREPTGGVDQQLIEQWLGLVDSLRIGPQPPLSTHR